MRHMEMSWPSLVAWAERGAKPLTRLMPCHRYTRMPAARDDWHSRNDSRGPKMQQPSYTASSSLCLCAHDPGHCAVNHSFVFDQSAYSPGFRATNPMLLHVCSLLATCALTASGSPSSVMCAKPRRVISAAAASTRLSNDSGSTMCCGLLMHHGQTDQRSRTQQQSGPHPVRRVATQSMMVAAGTGEIQRCGG
jgi:hypothetical protein